MCCLLLEENMMLIGDYLFEGRTHAARNWMRVNSFCLLICPSFLMSRHSNQKSSNPSKQTHLPSSPLANNNNNRFQLQ